MPNPFPRSFPTSPLQHCKLLEVRGLWVDAARCYADSCVEHPTTGGSYIRDKGSSMLSLQAEEDARPKCAWRRADSACPAGAGATCLGSITRKRLIDCLIFT